MQRDESIATRDALLLGIDLAMTAHAEIHTEDIQSQDMLADIKWLDRELLEYRSKLEDVEREIAALDVHIEWWREEVRSEEKCEDWSEEREEKGGRRGIRRGGRRNGGGRRTD